MNREQRVKIESTIKNLIQANENTLFLLKQLRLDLKNKSNLMCLVDNEEDWEYIINHEFEEEEDRKFFMFSTKAIFFKKHVAVKYFSFNGCYFAREHRNEYKIIPFDEFKNKVILK